MFRKIIAALSLRNMNTAEKKLSGTTRKVPVRRQEQATTTIISEVKNNVKVDLKRSAKNKNDIGNLTEEISKANQINVNAEEVVEPKKPRRIGRNKKIEEEFQDSPLEIVSNSSKFLNKTEETPSSSTSLANKSDRKKKSTKKDVQDISKEDVREDKFPIKVEHGDIPPTTTIVNNKVEKNLLKKMSSKKTPQESPNEDTDHAADKWQPENWQTLLENIRIMRSKDTAPVDTMGCHKCADENADEKTQRFHKLVALMLSSQTKDDTTYHAMLRLREHTLTPESICEMKLNVLENILHPVSFYKNKAKYLQQTSKILIEKYNSDIPNNIKELVALPGVGPKMAHICMSTAWDITTGIGVDVHVHRICNRLQWVPKATKEPEETRKALEAWLPRELWKEVNYLLVGFGQTICTPQRPKCLECLNCNICPAAPKTKDKKEKIENSEVLDLCDKAKFKKKKMHV
ncbi:nth-like DNA glycosylase 1 [Musca autumnalis]|uniref:nth-like DNA glycosylase 1 n=1 Tax=Musca autumnalis TaxID=221902 RepID=UPI003CEB2607